MQVLQVSFNGPDRLFLGDVATRLGRVWSSSHSVTIAYSREHGQPIHAPVNFACQLDPIRSSGMESFVP